MTTPAQITKVPAPLEVRDTTERMVYAVRSRTRPGREYRVDLLANGGAGGCACTDFGVRRQTSIDRGELSWTKPTTCIHLDAAGRHFLRALLKVIERTTETPS